MRRGGNYLPIIAVLLLVLFIVGIAAYTVHRISESPLLRLPLAEEESGKIELARGSVQAGYVYSLTWTQSGWAFAAKQNTRLIEKLSLSSVDLSVNDVIAPILWDWYFDGMDDYILFSGFSVPNMTSAYVDASVNAEVKNSKIFISYVPGNGPSIYFGITSGGQFWYEVWNSTSTSTTEGRISGWTFGQVGGYQHIQIVHTSTSIVAYVNGVEYTYTPLEDGPIHWLTNMKVGTLDTTSASTLKGRVSHICIADRNSLPNNWQVIENPYLLLSATFYNGTHYFDLVNGVVGAPYGGVTRVPSENPFLFLVKSLASDNKLHLKYFPPGTVIKIIDSNGNVIREYTVPSTDVNAAGLVEDYAVDLGMDILSGVNVEAVIPASKARIYAPPGFTVKVDLSSYSQEYTVPSTGYVDVPVDDQATVELLASAKQDDKLGISVYSEGSGLKVQVYNSSSGVAISNAVVIAKKNNLAASATTDANGFAEISGITPDAPITIEAYALNDGTIYTGSTVYSPPAQQNTLAAPAPTSSSHRTAIALLLIVFALIAGILLISRGGRRR